MVFTIPGFVGQSIPDAPDTSSYLASALSAAGIEPAVS